MMFVFTALFAGKFISRWFTVRVQLVLYKIFCGTDSPNAVLIQTSAYQCRIVHQSINLINLLVEQGTNIAEIELL